jgi:hypothetical protein
MSKYQESESCTGLTSLINLPLISHFNLVTTYYATKPINTAFTRREIEWFMKYSVK